MSNLISLTDEKAKLLSALIGGSLFTDEEREMYSKIIKDFNDLYYKLDRQTWCRTQWRGVNVLKPPTDLWVYQELITHLRPDLIVETGSHRGGSALFLQDMCNLNGHGDVITIDVNHELLHETARKSEVIFLKGSSISENILTEVKDYIEQIGCQKVMVILDSDHSYGHVLDELNAYGPLVTSGMPLIVEDSNNCESVMQAIEVWLPNHPEFKQDFECEKFMLTFNRGGYLEKAA